MRTSEADIFFLAGPEAMDADHWMVRWESRLATATRIAAALDGAVADALASRLHAAVASASRPIVLVAHGDGALAVARAAETNALAGVRGAFLVNPSSSAPVDRLPRGPLPFPALLVASRDDPHASFEEMSDRGYDWGAHVIDAGTVGRLDSGSGHGPWPEGLMRFGAFIARL